MTTIDIMTLEQEAREQQRTLRNRQQLAQLRPVGSPITLRVRTSIGSALVTIGDWIRPESEQHGPQVHA